MNTNRGTTRRRRRLRAVAGLVALASVAGAFVVLAPSANAAGTSSTYAVDVVNYSGTDVKVRFFYGAGEHQGDVSSTDLGPEFGNARKLPNADAVTLDSGATSVTYGYQVPAQSFDNGYWIEVTRGDDPRDRTVAKAYRWDPAATPPTVVDQAGASLVVSSRYEPRSASFSGEKTRILITEPRTVPDLPYGDASWPYQGPWDRDIRVGQDNGGWTPVDATTQQWKMSGLPPTSDYWFRCYDSSFTRLLFNGYSPTVAQLGGGSTGGKPNGFWVTSDHNGVITVTRPVGPGVPAGGTCDVHRTVTVVDAKRITGSSTMREVNKRPIYKVDIKPSSRIFDQPMPDQLRIPPYVIEGKTSAGVWRHIGVVLPASKVRLEGDTASYGGATFYFQNKPGDSITQLRVSGGYGGWSNEIALAGLAAPTVPMTEISAMNVTPQRGSGTMPLEANGVDHQGVDVKLFDNDGDLITSGPLAAVYDSTYFRDEDDRLITGLYDPDGSSTVTGPDGNRRASFSSTDSAAGLTWITPNLDLDDHLDDVDLRAALAAPQHRLFGTISTGVSIARGDATAPIAAASADAAPVYRVRASGAGAADNPATVAVLAYQALVPSTALPRTNIQSGGLAAIPLVAQAGSLKLAPGTDPSLIGDLGQLTVTAVSVYGTAIGPYTAPVYSTH